MFITRIEGEGDTIYIISSETTSSEIKSIVARIYRVEIDIERIGLDVLLESYLPSDCKIVNPDNVNTISVY